MRSNVSAVINQTHPFSETRRMCACVRVGEWTCLLASRVPARHNSVAGGWRLAGAELCRSCWVLRWSLSVSVARAVINHERVGEQTQTGPTSSSSSSVLPTALTPHRSANPDLNGRITVRMMSGLKNHRSETMPHNSSGSPRPVSVDMGELIVWRGTVPCFACKSDTNMCTGRQYKCDVGRTRFFLLMFRMKGWNCLSHGRQLDGEMYQQWRWRKIKPETFAFIIYIRRVK